MLTQLIDIFYILHYFLVIYSRVIAHREISVEYSRESPEAPVQECDKRHMKATYIDMESLKETTLNRPS